jgi:hypothetical protein
MKTLAASLMLGSVAAKPGTGGKYIKWARLNFECFLADLLNGAG